MPLYWTTDWTDGADITSSGDGDWLCFTNTTTNPTYTASSLDWCDDYTATTTSRTIVVRNANDRWWLDRRQPRYDWLERWYMREQVLADRAALEAQRRVIAAHVDTAQSKALDLLLRHLTPQQRESFNQHKWFIVEGGFTGRRYRIRDKGSMVANIDVLNGEAVEHRLCGHCDPREVPLADNLLAQKLMLEADEEAFLRIANRHAA